MKLSKNIWLHELVPQREFETLGRQCLARGLVTEFQIKATQFLRDYYGKKVFINNWKSGGKLQYRGYRPKDCKVGGLYSMHRIARAVDLDVEGVPAEEVREDIRKKPGIYMSVGITRIESKVNWLHIDNYETGELEVVEFNPN